jgi:hypothetical protein
MVADCFCERCVGMEWRGKWEENGWPSIRRAVDGRWRIGQQKQQTLEEEAGKQKEKTKLEFLDKTPDLARKHTYIEW